MKKKNTLLKKLPFYITLVIVLIGIRYYKNYKKKHPVIDIKKADQYNISKKPLGSPTTLVGSRDEIYDTPEKIYKFFSDPKIDVTYSNHSKFSEKCKNLEFVKKEIYVNYISQKEYYDDLERKFDEYVIQGYIAPIYIKWVNDKIGYGVYALEDIPEDTLIGEYVGNIVYKEDILERTWSWKYPSHGKFIDKYPQNLSVNSYKYGNEMRFINHDYDKERNTPNVKTVFCYVNKAWRLLYVAKRYIVKDEELTVSYGPKYWRRRKKT